MERERERESTYKKHPIIIWALYDDAKSSYKSAIEKYFKNKNINVHSFGINNIKFNKSDKYFYHLIDLSLINFNLINQLKAIAKEFGKPNIILASPPCESWSGADCNGKMIRSIDKNGNWIVKNASFYEQYNKQCHPVKRRYFLQKEQGRILGEATIGATIQIIDVFKPQAWVIENPQTSKTWDFQKYHWNFNKYNNKNVYLNLTYYSCYDSNFSKKPTIFKSNIKLDLKKEKVYSNNNHMAYGTYSQRSSIPLTLIKDMIDQIINSIKNDIFLSEEK